MDSFFVGAMSPTNTLKKVPVRGGPSVTICVPAHDTQRADLRELRRHFFGHADREVRLVRLADNFERQHRDAAGRWDGHQRSRIRRARFSGIPDAGGDNDCGGGKRQRREQGATRRRPRSNDLRSDVRAVPLLNAFERES